MSKERVYEMTVIFDSGIEDEKIDEKIKGLEEKISEVGGGVEEVARWGKKRLAYPIRKKESGIYVILTFKFMTDSLGELERGLKMDEQILRYLIINKETQS
jgi:small subunit ribosomal protein S6